MPSASAVFGDSVWGFLAGAGMIMNPLYLLSLYFLLVYLLGRNWLLLLFAALLIDRHRFSSRRSSGSS